MTYDINVNLIPWSNPKFKEAVTENEDGSYTIFINANMASNQIEQAYRHAMWHIAHHDFERADVQQIEAEAHEQDL